MFFVRSYMAIRPRFKLILHSAIRNEIVCVKGYTPLLGSVCKATKGTPPNSDVPIGETHARHTHRHVVCLQAKVACESLECLVKGSLQGLRFLKAFIC